jgi:uncharacterized protein (TIGR02596 family)
MSASSLLPTGLATRSASTNARRRRAGFTLIEMLAVLGIVGVVAGVAAPAVLGVISSTRLTQAGDELSGLISQAQQIAVSESRPVEVRFYNMTAGAGAISGPGEARYRGVMIVKYYQTGELDPTLGTGAVLSEPMAVADFGGLYRLPSGVIMSDTARLNTFMKLPEVPAKGGSGGGGTQLVVKRGATFEPLALPEAVDYRAFLCLPESTNLNAADNWFVTLLQINDANLSPSELKNFYAIQIEPVTGRLMSYRP